MRVVRFSSWLKLAGAWGLVLGLVLLLAEGAARLFVTDPTAALTQDVQNVLTRPGLPAFGQAFDFDADLFWVLKPGLSDWAVKGSLDKHPFDFCFSTTMSRLRAMPAMPAPEHERILALGDSCTFGFGVKDDESWPAQLQMLLNTGRTVDAIRVINAGVPGYTAFQGLQYLKRNGFSLKPDLVLVSFWANDQIRAASISDEERAAQYAWLRYDSFLMRSRFYVGLKKLLRNAAPLSLWSNEKPERARLDEEQYEHALREILNVCAERRIRVIFVQWPMKWQVSEHMALHPYQDIMSNVAASTGAPIVNLAPAFGASRKDLFFDAIHGNAAGCEIAARTIAAEVIRVMASRSK